MYSLPQKLAAEFIGTFTIISIAVGSVCADQYLGAASQSRSALWESLQRTGWLMPP